MKSNFIYLVIAMSFLMLSCVSTNNQRATPLTIVNFDLVTIGSNKHIVESNLGKPSKVSLDSWVYLTSDHPANQRGAVTFDSDTQLVSSKTFIPLDDENDQSLDFLIKSKFSVVKFQQTRLQRCKRDYVPSKIFFINVTNGLVIEFDSRNKTVDSITWTSPSAAQTELKKIQRCDR